MGQFIAQAVFPACLGGAALLLSAVFFPQTRAPIFVGAAIVALVAGVELLLELR